MSLPLAVWRAVLWNRRANQGFHPAEPGLTALLEAAASLAGECPDDVAIRAERQGGGTVGEEKGMPKLGDWGFYEFRVATVKAMGQYGPTISNGIIQIGTRDFAEWRPLTLRNAAVSRVFGDMSDKLHREGSAGLNYPDFARHLVSLWLQACDGDEKATDRAAKFVEDVLREDRGREVDGISLTRPRWNR